MASPVKKLKVEDSDFSSYKTLIRYKNVHCSQSCMKLYLQEETADIHFVFEAVNDEAVRVPAHKYILGIGSTVFHSMFYGSLKEEGDIRITDTTIDAFKEFLQFFYLDHVTITMECVADIMYLANKYDIPECFNVCETFLKENLPTENICVALQLAVTFDRSELVKFLSTKISEKPIEIFASISFKSCSWDILKLILEINNLDCAEKAVFDACMAWSEKACEKNNLDPLDMKHRREHLGDCFNLIQFALMKPTEIAYCVMKFEDLFKRDELVQIIAILSSDNSIKLQSFNRKRRSQNVFKWNENTFLKFSRNYPPAQKNCYINEIEITPFVTNKRLLLGAVATPVINPWTHDRKELSGVMKILECSSKHKILLDQPVNLALGGRFEPRNIIKLTEPITVEPKTKYEIRFEFDSSWSEEVYDTKKLITSQIQSFGDCRMLFGGSGSSGNGIVSHLYYN